ncbi:LCP family protein [Mechercharimyces sp. CAU 1602]|uniref:LCP family glycopolymer transferase n=1 Tax=Mechercharimyces sp. CAU 1602 TaxID=2973933 RepID=UPI0021621851|nr:LCP family protein [Mechercharimyces sp. CAU 1602]MCS1352241.1 LCP family protein [Mechercharimyces sp. CAU 1602]
MDKIDQSRIDRVKKKKRKKRIIRIVAVISLVLIIGATYYGITLANAVNKSFVPLERDTSDHKEEAKEMKEPFSILLIGADVKSMEKSWRPDVLMLITVNPEKKTMKTLSIPRDTLVDIANTNGKDKINHAAVYGTQNNVDPIQNTIETVENYFNVPIYYYSFINFQGFVDVVDKLGGVEVNPSFSFSIKQFGKYHTYTEGVPTQLNGEEALAYVRMRKQDPDGDAGRNRRQQEVLDQLVDKLTSFESVTKADDIISSIGNNFQRDIAIKDIPKLKEIYSSIPDTQKETLELKGKNQKLNLYGQYIYYYIVSEEERQRVSDNFRDHLNEEPQTVDGQPKPEETEPEMNDPSGSSGTNTPGDTNGANTTSP